MPPRIDVAGQKFGCSLAIRFEETASNGHHRKWEVQNDCGITQTKSIGELKKRTCRCLRNIAIGAARTTHGQSNSPEYLSWIAMKNRCSNPNTDDWKNYGGRGITVCDRWINSFQNFLDDMGKRPSKTHSLDRERNAEGYKPGNCRWATKIEQVRNRRNCRLFTFDGETLSAAEWGRRLGGTAMLVTHRLTRGWEYEKAFTTPAKNYK